MENANMPLITSVCFAALKPLTPLKNISGDVTKHTKADGTVSYEIAVRRLTCIPHPKEFTVNGELMNIERS